MRNRQSIDRLCVCIERRVAGSRAPAPVQRGNAATWREMGCGASAPASPVGVAPDEPKKQTETSFTSTTTAGSPVITSPPERLVIAERRSSIERKGGHKERRSSRSGSTVADMPVDPESGKTMEEVLHDVNAANKETGDRMDAAEALAETEALAAAEAPAKAEAETGALPASDEVDKAARTKKGRRRSGSTVADMANGGQAASAAIEAEAVAFALAEAERLAAEAAEDDDDDDDDGEAEAQQHADIDAAAKAGRKKKSRRRSHSTVADMAGQEGTMSQEARAAAEATPE